jgi:uncharacterized protein (TIGR01777 family)
MRIAITGSSGLVGKQLASFLMERDHDVISVVRRAPSENEIRWDPTTGEIEGEKFEGVGAVINLAGENIAEGRWNAAKKQRIRDSRVKSTQLLAKTLASLSQRPDVLVNASAIGFYGDRGDEPLDENSPPGNDFLADVCREWEAATSAAQEAGIRVVKLRIGVVLSPDGGALKKMLLPFRLGAGGRVGNGRQYWSWISIDDLVGIIDHALTTESLAGPVNAVAPRPTTNLEFTKALGRVLHRPTIFPMPAFAAKLALGEMAEALLLASTRVVPRRLQETNYEFRHADLEAALRHLLGK